jgi:hypothetical protein
MIISRGPTLHLCRVLRCRTIPGNRPRFREQADGGRPGLSIHLASRNVIRRGVGGVLPQDRSMERPRKGGLDGACMRSFNSPVQLVEISWGRPVKPSLKLGICGLYVIMEGAGFGGGPRIGQSDGDSAARRESPLGRDLPRAEA